MTLYEETLRAINRNNKDIDDIIFIGSEITGHYLVGIWDTFSKISKFEYDSGFGSQKIASDLIIVFNDLSRLVRDDYDGAESWEFIRAFKMPKTLIPVDKLTTEGAMWDTLESINEEDEEK